MGRIGEIIMVDAKQINDWKTQYGTVYKLQAVEEGIELEVYIKKPSRQIYDRFTSGLITKKSSLEATKQLLFDVLLAPSKEELLTKFDEKPGLVSAIGNKLMEITGSSVNFTATAL